MNYQERTPAYPLGMSSSLALDFVLSACLLNPELLLLFSPLSLSYFAHNS